MPIIFVIFLLGSYGFTRLPRTKKMKNDGVQVTPLLLQGPTVETILEEADDIDADMIIAGSHGHGMMYNIFIGSISKELLKHSTRPILIVPVKNGNS